MCEEANMAKVEAYEAITRKSREVDTFQTKMDLAHGKHADSKTKYTKAVAELRQLIKSYDVDLPLLDADGEPADSTEPKPEAGEGESEVL